MAKGHLDQLQKAEIVSKNKLVHSVFIRYITELITDNKSFNRGGRYRQVSLYRSGSAAGLETAGFFVRSKTLIQHKDAILPV